eukprot:TRINITY_DN7729_c0_g2_i1.p1 TRINITY_DN7729_c0_g2~~TRINITY_DN7729_c0_g2_i1.p1  ORF type:complete len:396 (+),score=60.12 TRINITY_DN7729_c0_g2_i1:90-1190(+)
MGRSSVWIDMSAQTLLPAGRLTSRRSCGDAMNSGLSQQLKAGFASSSTTTRPIGAAISSLPSSSFSNSASLASSSSSFRLPLFSFCNEAAATRPCTRRQAKFQQFERPESFISEEDMIRGEAALADEEGTGDTEEEVADTRDDSMLPSSLEDAVNQGSQAAAFLSLSGGLRICVELLVPELQNLSEDGAQERLWLYARSFVEGYQAQLMGQKVKAIFPDAGSAAMLKFQWPDAPFAIASLSDRVPVSDDDDAVVLIAPDFQALADVERVAALLKPVDGPPRPLVMWNPRLVSGDVGIGLNVRRLRENFLNSFTTAYLLRPLNVGAVYRCYPGLWKLFLDDPDVPGRYLLFREQENRPDLDDIEVGV